MHINNASPPSSHADPQFSLHSVLWSARERAACPCNPLCSIYEYHSTMFVHVREPGRSLGYSGAQFCRSSARGGGVALCVRGDHPAIPFPELSLLYENNMELAVVRISNPNWKYLPDLPIIPLAVYRSPSANFIVFFNALEFAISKLSPAHQ